MNIASDGEGRAAVEAQSEHLSDLDEVGTKLVGWNDDREPVAQTGRDQILGNGQLSNRFPRSWECIEDERLPVIGFKTRLGPRKIKEALGKFLLPLPQFNFLRQILFNWMGGHFGLMARNTKGLSVELFCRSTFGPGLDVISFPVGWVE